MIYVAICIIIICVLITLIIITVPIEQITNIVIKIIKRNRSIAVAPEQQSMDQRPIQFPQIIIGWSENPQDSINIASEIQHNPDLTEKINKFKKILLGYNKEFPNIIGNIIDEDLEIRLDDDILLHKNIECCVCFENKPSVSNLACTHTVCDKCYELLKESSNICPQCRKPLSDSHELKFIDSKGSNINIQSNDRDYSNILNIVQEIISNTDKSILE
jgi:hypothetical protein